jgi:hypothetical protein
MACILIASSHRTLLIACPHRIFSPHLLVSALVPWPLLTDGMCALCALCACACVEQVRSTEGYVAWNFAQRVAYSFATPEEIDSFVAEFGP